jgi:hypothetical protein
VTLPEGGKLLPLRKQDLPFFTSFFLIMAALVMLIACANVANMTLARGIQRRVDKLLFGLLSVQGGAAFSAY